MGSQYPVRFERLDRGERDAILLALAIEADLLIVDERDGRRVAKALDLAITGTIGMLDVAASEGLVDIPEVITRLRKTSFRASPSLYQWLLRRHT